MSNSNEIAKVLQAEVDRQAALGTVPGMADFASAVLNSRWGQEIVKREAERDRLRKAAEFAAHVALNNPSGLRVMRAMARAALDAKKVAS